jgi:hypothetical protein
MSSDFRHILDFDVKIKDYGNFFYTLDSFDPNKDRVGNTCKLFDNKPGIFYYDQRFLAFVYTYVRWKSTSKTERYKILQIFIAELKPTGITSKTKMIAINLDNKTKEASAFVRSIISSCRFHTKDWDNVLNYFISQCNKLEAMLRK